MHLTALDLNLLPLLLELLETRSVKTAATRTALSPSATSHALNRMREALADPLLVRAGRAMQLTPRAEALLPKLRHALLMLEQSLRQDDTFQAGSLHRTFRIATTDYVELVLAPALGAEVAQQAKRVNLIYQRAPDAVERLRSGSVDLLISVTQTLPDDIRCEPLFDERFVCVLRAGHPALAHNLTARRFAALEHLLVSPSGGSRGVVDQHLEQLGLKRRVARCVASFTAAPYQLRNSDMVLTVAERVAQTIGPGIGLTLVEPPIELGGFSLTLAWHQRTELDPAHSWLRDCVRRTALQIA